MSALPAPQHDPADAARFERDGDRLRAAGEPRRAISLYRQALALEPGRLSARFAIAEAWREAGEPEAALPVLDALRRELPHAWQAHHDFANALRDLGRFAEAEIACRAALACAENPTTLGQLGAILRDRGRPDDAVAMLDRALALAPRDIDARYHRALAHLTAGRLEAGFAEYDSRFAKFADPVPASRHWQSGPPGSRTVLVRAEQGFGDTLQFVRYLPALAASGARVVLQVPAPLLRLLRQFPGTAGVVADNAEPPRHALHVRLMSLPQRLGLAVADPIPVPYLQADEGAVQAWRQRLATFPGLKIGIAWTGRPTFPADRLRSLPPDRLAPLAALRGVQLVSLQKPARPYDLPLLDWTDELDDFADTADLVAALDLVISVDTAVAHLAGALGRPVWLLHRAGGCWRWQTEGAGTCWYPTMRIFRQAHSGEWEPVVDEIVAALRQRFDAS